MLRYISGANAPGASDGVIAEDGGINVRALPEDIQEVFADIDANGDGVLDMDEFKTMLSTYAVLRKSNQEGSVSISTLPDKVQPALKIFDQDGDGTVDPKELMRAAELYQASKKSQKRMRKFIIGMVLFIIALIGINSAMTFMMVELGKETKASPDGVMRVNAGGGQQGAVVRTAANGEPAPLTSASSGRRVRAAQAVRGRLARPARTSPSSSRAGTASPTPRRSKTGNVVKIITYAGFIILDGAEMTFEETVGNVFSEAGFDVIRPQAPRHLRDRRHFQLHRRLGRPRRRGEKTRFRQARCVYFNSRIRYTGNQFDVVFCQQISTWSTALSTSASWLSARPIPAWTCTTTRTAPTSRSTASTTSRSTAPSSWTWTPASPWKRISTQNSTRPSRR